MCASPGFGMEDEGTFRLTRVALPLSGGTFNVMIDRGRVGAIHGVDGDPEWLLLPAFANLHCHAERSYACAPPASSFQEALRRSEELRAGSSEQAFADRAGRLFSRALAHGTLRLRTHTDIDDLVAHRALNGVKSARERFAGQLDVEIVAFASARIDPASPEGRHRLEAAIAEGVDFLGAVPALAPAPGLAVDAMLDLACATGLPVDFHLDEHGDPDRSLLAHLVDAVVARNLQGQVTVSHACALSVLPRDVTAAIAAAMAEARITVVALPATNLYLQNRGAETPRWRGVTLVKELVAAGVPVRFGSDNIRDSFYPYGDADPLEVGFLASLAAQVDDPALLVAGLCAGRGEPSVGDPADLVLIRADSLQDALARRPAERIVLRGGHVVSSTVREPFTASGRGPG